MTTSQRVAVLQQVHWRPTALVPTGAVRVIQALAISAVWQSHFAQRLIRRLMRTCARYAALADICATARWKSSQRDSSQRGTVPQSFVALRRNPTPDDGRSPRRRSDTRRESPSLSPLLNLADRQLLDQSLETFKRTLAPARPCPTA
jgi:hypothetical protein